MLVLFDIDGTLLTGDGLGMRALAAAGRRLHGPDFTADGVQYAGRLDPLIVADILDANRVDPTPEAFADLREAYLRALRDTLAESPARALPGAADLVERFAREPAVAVGLLTGNFEPSGTMKLESAGHRVDRFTVRVWGDDSPHDPPHRDHLPSVAIERHARIAGARLDPERVLIIGDTPGDVRCARAAGCRCLAVATGSSTQDDLRAAGADRVAPDLADTETIAAWALTP